MKAVDSTLRPRAAELLTLAVVLLTALLGCKKLTGGDEPPPVAETAAAPTPPPAATPNASPTSAGAISVGSPVVAPWSRAGRMYGGTLKEIYGKLGFVKFNDGDSGWALLAKMRPAGTPAPDPVGDSCQFSVGDNVKAPWSTNKAMYSGKVSEVYGRLVRVDFLDGDQGYAECSETQSR